jgi:hypothetical protein
MSSGEKKRNVESKEKNLLKTMRNNKFLKPIEDSSNILVYKLIYDI